MRLKVKKLVPDAKLPTKATSGSACYDIYAFTYEDIRVSPEQVVKIGTGLAFEIPPGHMIEVRPRSGLSKEGILLVNSPCTIDSDYRGELYILLTRLGIGEYKVQKGDRVAQIRLVEVPEIQFQEVKELSKTERGENGLGSTGR